MTRAGVADSKAFGAGPKAHERRVKLVRLIETVALHIDYEVCDVEDIDEAVSMGWLNDLERSCAQRLLERAPQTKRIVADGARIFGRMQADFPQLEAHNDGESVHVAVAAASLCAKVRRDELFACIADRYAPTFGPLRGGGYTNAGTRAFVDAYRSQHGAMPPEARLSWPWPETRARSPRHP